MLSTLLRRSLALPQRHVRAPGAFRHQIQSLSTIPKGGVTPAKEEDDKAPKSKLREMWDKYGYVAIGTYGGVYVGTLGMLYSLLSADILAAGGAIDLLKFVHADSLFNLEELDPKVGNFGVAWILTKFTEPLRAVTTIAITPAVARALNPLIKNEAVEQTIRDRKG